MPIELAAVCGTREDMELLFPFTSPIPNVEDWSVDGIINHAKLDSMQLLVIMDDRSMISEMDPGSYKTFDSSYYGYVAKRRGLFRSDAALLTDATTREYVNRIATGKFNVEFFEYFSASMIKMGNVGVLTGTVGRSGKSVTAAAAVDFNFF